MPPEPNTKPFQAPNTKPFQANQPEPSANGLPAKGLGNQGKESSGGSSPGKKDHNPYSNDGLQVLKPLRRTQTYHDQILEMWWPSEVDEEQPTVENKHNWPHSLFEMTDTKNNFFHNLLIKLPNNIPDTAKGWLESLVLESPDLLASENTWNISPIRRAAKVLPTLVFLVFDLVIPETVRKILETHGANSLPCDACPLWGVSPSLRNFRPLRGAAPNKDLDDKVSETIPAAVHDNAAQKAQDDLQGSSAPRSCLHSEVNMKDLLKRENELRSSLKRILAHPDLACEVLKSLLVETRFDTGQENAQVIKLQSFRNILELSPDDAFTTVVSPNGYNLLQLAVDLFDKNSIDYDLQFKVIEALVQRSPASIFHEYETSEGGNRKKENVYCLLREAGNSAEPKRVDDVRKLIKVACIRYREEDSDPIKTARLQAKKRSLLYSHGETGRRNTNSFT